MFKKKIEKDVNIIFGILILFVLSVLEIGMDIKKSIDYEMQHGIVITEETE